MDDRSPIMRVFVTDYEAVLRVRAPLQWHPHPGSALNGMLKRGLDRVDPMVRAQLLAPVVPDPKPHYSLQARQPAPAALFPVLPRTGTGPQGALIRDEKIPIRLRRFGHADEHTDKCIESALHYLDEGLIVEPGSWLPPWGRFIEVDDQPTQDARVALDFITPGILEFNDEVRVDIKFSELIKLVRRRLEAICVLYGELPSGVSERFLCERLPGASAVDRTRSTLYIERWKSSRRSQRPYKVEGLLGEIEFEGPLGPFMPTLVAAQEIQVGKDVSAGLGRFALALGLDVLEPPLRLADGVGGARRRTSPSKGR